MGKNFMPLGAKAKNDMKKEEKRAKADLLTMREQFLTYRRKLAAVRAPLLKSGPIVVHWSRSTSMPPVRDTRCILKSMARVK